jgi:GNAT superfamily N-acetyltransferase
VTDDITIRFDPKPTAADLATFDAHWTGAELDRIYRHSLTHACAYVGDTLVGYVNVAWDGGVHAFLLDPTVHPSHRRRGIGSGLVKRAIEIARDRGATWMHVDYEPQLDHFYKSCGFRDTAAGVLKL